MRVLIPALALGLLIAGSTVAQTSPPQIAQLHDALHLSAQQNDAWQAYAKATTPNPQVLSRRRSAQQLLPQLPTPRRIALMEAVMEDQLADFHRQSAAVGAFYAQLTPEQQRVFDQQTGQPNPR